MGTVYEAVAADGQPVAVKTLAGCFGDDAGLRRRFEAEIDALKALRHPGIVRLLAFGEEAGVPFFAMELVPGRSLEEILKAGRRFSWQETVATAAAIVRALKAAHDQGIVHRDLKPANLLFAAEESADGGVKLADFGIARLFGDAGQTLAGTVVGTAEYMAPEQAAGGPVDHRVDLYALGLVMYAMLTGRPPFRGGEVAEVLRRQRRETPARVSAVAEVPPALDLLIEKLLAKEPADRPPSSLAVGRLLEAIEVEAAAPGPQPENRPAHDHQSRGTPPIAPAQTLGTGVDLLAATCGTLAGDSAARGTRAAGSGKSAGRPGEAATLEFAPPTAADAGASLAHRPTVPAPGGEESRPPAATRFTTVAELEQVRRAEADRQRRSDRAWRWAVAAGLAALGTALAFAVVRPASPDTLHARIMAVADDPAADLRDARRWIEAFLARHGDDPRADAVKELGRRLAVDALERQARRRARSSTPVGPLERDYRAAMAREPESALACLVALEAIQAVHAAEAAEGGPDSDAALWLAVARRQIDRLAPAAAREREEDSARVAASLAEAAKLSAEAMPLADAERAAVEARRRELLAGIIEIYASRPHVAEAVAEARQLLSQPERPEP
jgi:hypothetical protein